MKNNLEKIEYLLKIINEGVSKEELERALANVLTAIKRTEQRNKDALAALELAQKALAASAEDSYKRKLSMLGEEVSKIISRLENKMSELKNGTDGNTPVKGIDYFDGYTPRKGIDYFDGKDGKNGSPDTPEQIRNKLETLEGNDRLDAKAISGIEEMIKKFGQVAQTNLIGFGGGRRRIQAYSLTSQCNGSTKAFTLPRGTKYVIGVFGTQFPQNFDPESDYTVSGYTLTLGDSVGAPQTGQTLWVLLEMNFLRI